MGFFGRSHSVTTRADKISDFIVNTTQYGAPVAEVLGTTRVSGNVIYYDDFTAHEHRESHRTGKGGHKSKSNNITYTYTVAVIFGLCEGPISRVDRVWRGKDLYTYPDRDIQLTLFNGSENQKAWAYTRGKHPDKALAYPGLAYMAGVIDLGDSGSMPSFNFEVKGKLLNTGDGIDVNPADYIRFVLDKVGLSSVEIDGLDNYRRFCREADLLISTPIDDNGESKTAQSIINEIATLTNAYIFWSNDHFKIVPLEDRPVGSWTPDNTITYDLTADDFIPQADGALVTYQRKDSSECYNYFPVEFYNRNNGYEKESISYAITTDIADHGIRQASTTAANYFYTKERAVKIGEMLARANQCGRNRYTFKLDWAFCRLEVGDLVTLTDKNCGLDRQAALINSITEDGNGILTITAISRPKGNYSAAKYNVHNLDRPYVNYDQEAPDTDKPVILQPPADLTVNGLELWIGAKGTADLWGGCNVYVSDDNSHYRLAGQITNTARIGALAISIDDKSTTIEVAANGDFLSGGLQDAERGNTLCWVDGECFSYENAILLANGHYQFTGCIRGQYNTSAGDHAKGASFARLDTALLRIPFRKEDINKKIWLKFVSYNIFGSGEQSLAEVDAYEYTIAAYYIPSISNVNAYNRYRQMQDGISRYDIVVTWDPPILQSYLSGEVWYKTNHQQAMGMVVREGTIADSMGFDGEWVYGGSGKNQVVIPQAVVGDVYRICVCTKDEWGASISPDMAPSIDILVAIKTTVPNVPDNFSIRFSSTAVVAWDEVTNTDVSCYEVRLDPYPGVESAGLLTRTNSLSASVSLTQRQGKLYLYAKNALGKYSDAAILNYHKSLPPTPKAPTLTATLGGFGVQAERIPVDCIGMNVYINDNANAKTVNNTFSYTCGAGIYDVSVAYYDMFGEGEKSAQSRVVVKIEIDSDMIKNESISLEKVDKAIQETIANGGEAGAAVKVITDNLNKPDGYTAYTALTQLDDAINLRVKSDDVINQINISKESVLIDGDKIHITGQTIFDDNVIVRKMLAANAVSADKMDVSSLSAISAIIGTLRTKTSGARVEIKDNLIEVYDSNNVLRIRMGVW